MVDAVAVGSVAGFVLFVAVMFVETLRECFGLRDIEDDVESTLDFPIPVSGRSSVSRGRGGSQPESPAPRARTGSGQ